MKAQARVMALQVRVMRWQGHISVRHERIQNQLIRLQQEHEWLMRLNAEREQGLRLARRLHLSASCLEQSYSAGDNLNWEELRKTAHELSERLRILDIGAHSGVYDGWFADLEEYVEAVRNIVFEDGSFGDASLRPKEGPSVATRTALKDADYRHKT